MEFNSVSLIDKSEPSASDELLSNPILINITSALLPNGSNDDSITTTTIATTITNTTNFATSVLPTSFKFWTENRKICELFSQAVQDLTRDLDPFAAVLILVALVIAIAGIIAIVCQCHMWRKSKRIKHYDTNSWLEYSLDREKLTHNNNNNNNGNAKLQRQLENKKFISKLFQSSLLPPTATLVNGTSSNLRKFAFNDSQLYLNHSHHHHHSQPVSHQSTPVRQSSSSQFTAVDIDQCQLVQSFMKHENGKQYIEGLKKHAKEAKKVAKKMAKSGTNRVEDRVNKGGGAKKAKEEAKKQKKRSKQLKAAKKGQVSPDTLPFFTNASVSSKSSDQSPPPPEQNRSTSMRSASLQKEYETQTLELNLTASEDGDSQSIVSAVDEDKIYERIVHTNKAITKKTVPTTNPATQMVTVTSSSANLGSHKPLSVAAIARPPTVVTQSVPRAVAKSSTTLTSGQRQRQQMPPTTVDQANRTQARHLSAKLIANQYHHHHPQQQQQASRRSSSSTTATTVVSAAPVSKNPLYSEIGDHEEPMMVSSVDDSCVVWPHRSQVAKDRRPKSMLVCPTTGHTPMPVSSRPMTYSTFMKPPSPPNNR